MPLVIEIDIDELEGLAAKLKVDGRTMQRAAKVAANRTVRWARTQLQRDLSARLGAPQGAFKTRLKALLSQRGRNQAALWIALRPLNVVRVGPRKTRRGLRGAGQDFEGAFVARGRYGDKAALRRKGKASTPLEAVSLDVHGAAVPAIELSTWPRMQEQFIRFYQAELERRAS